MWTQLRLQMRAWFIHLFTSHCEECDARNQCKHCDELFQLLERERAERLRILDIFTTQRAPIEESHDTVDYSKIGPLSWRSKRQQLEHDSFMKAHAPKSVDEASNG